MFDVRVAGSARLSPAFLRVTFTGDDPHEFADNGFDQRIKLILPIPGHGLAHLPTGPDWSPAGARWRRAVATRWRWPRRRSRSGSPARPGRRRRPGSRGRSSW
ncbi:siderophore-interacting protein [Nonomuraea sp. NPDC002799]